MLLENVFVFAIGKRLLIENTDTFSIRQTFANRKYSFANTDTFSFSKRLLIENTDTFSFSKRLLIENNDTRPVGT